MARHARRAPRAVLPGVDLLRAGTMNRTSSGVRLASPAGAPDRRCMRRPFGQRLRDHGRATPVGAPYLLALARATRGQRAKRGCWLVDIALAANNLGLAASLMERRSRQRHAAPELLQLAQLRCARSQQPKPRPTLQTWVTGTRWTPTAGRRWRSRTAAQNQMLRAIRAEGEVQMALHGLRRRNGPVQGGARTGLSPGAGSLEAADHIEASIIDTSCAWPVDQDFFGTGLAALSR